ncbi:MAG: hypothetical protein U0236_08910 [Nitrospira sp.]
MTLGCEVEQDGRADTEKFDRPVDQHMVLLGRPPLKRFLDYVEDLAVDGRAADVRALTEEWHAARANIRDIAKQELGWVDKPTIRPLPAQLKALHDQLSKDPILQNGFRIETVDVGIVELDRLLVTQRHINLEHVQRLKRTLGTSPSEEDIFKFCLPFDHPQPLTRWRQTDGNTFVFISPSNDLRFLDATVLTSDQLTGYPPPGSIAGVVGAVVGFGSNFLHAIHVEDRLVLNNGNHRAFALRDMGITHAPCLIRHMANREELRAATSSELRKNPDLYLKHPRPAVLKDYFDPRLHKIIDVHRTMSQIIVKVDVKCIEIPTI